MNMLKHKTAIAEIAAANSSSQTNMFVMIQELAIL